MSLGRAIAQMSDEAHHRVWRGPLIHGIANGNRPVFLCHTHERGRLLLRYTEIFSDADGVSHFRDVEVTMALKDLAPPTPAFHVSEFDSAASVGFLRIPPGWGGGWHPAPSDGYVLVLAGTVQIEVGDGELRQFSPGSVWRHKDVAGQGHDSRVIGDREAILSIVNLS
jgi:hypothetical protein